MTWATMAPPGVGKAGDGVVGVAMPIVEVEIAIAIVPREIEAVVPVGRRGNIHGDSVIRSQLAIRRETGHDLLHKLRMGCSAKLNLRSNETLDLARHFQIV